LKDKINELAVNGKNKNTRDLYRKINEFNKGYLLAYSHKVWNRWMNYCSQFLNVHKVGDVMQIDMHTHLSH
jgi:hypothetical protein